MGILGRVFASEFIGGFTQHFWTNQDRVFESYGRIRGAQTKETKSQKQKCDKDLHDVSKRLLPLCSISSPRAAGSLLSSSISLSKKHQKKKKLERKQ